MECGPASVGFVLARHLQGKITLTRFEVMS
jgi:hypothetical protein